MTSLCNRYLETLDDLFFEQQQEALERAAVNVANAESKEEPES